jgi:hypothetical protein
MPHNCGEIGLALFSRQRSGLGAQTGSPGLVFALKKIDSLRTISSRHDCFRIESSDFKSLQISDFHFLSNRPYDYMVGTGESTTFGCERSSETRHRGGFGNGPKVKKDLTNLERELAKLKEAMGATRPKVEPLVLPVVNAAVSQTMEAVPSVDEEREVLGCARRDHCARHEDLPAEHVPPHSCRSNNQVIREDDSGE